MSADITDKVNDQAIDIINDEIADKELTELYQLRTKSIDAPIINLPAQAARELTKQALIKPINANKPTSKVAISKFIFMMLGGGLASFSILAFISHLAQQPNLPKPNVDIKTSTVTIAYQEADEPITQLTTVTEVETDKKTLPKLIEHTQPEIKRVSVDHQPLLVKNNSAIKTSDFTNELAVNAGFVLQYKVLPQYNVIELNSEKEGRVKLSYKILPSGNVENIYIVESNVSRSLQKASVEALKQWRYLPNNSPKEASNRSIHNSIKVDDESLIKEHEVIFKFSK